MKIYLDGWKRMFNFKDKSTRSQFWTFSIINSILFFSAYLLMVADLVFNGEHAIFVDYLSIGLFVFGILYLIAGLSITVRRLHDSGKSGWCILLGIIPFIGWLILLVFYLLPSEN